VNRADYKFALPAVLLFIGIVAAAAERVNEHALRVQEFETRVAAYLKLHKQAAAEVSGLKPTQSPSAINQHEQDLAAAIRQIRRHAKRGDIFTSSISSEFHRLISLAMQGRAGVEIRDSFRRAEPVSLRLHVNDSYPVNVPLQSTPPTLLENLPPLPKELDYRVIGTDLVLRDVDANLIIDLIPHAIP
jgi:hypothetical protein